MVTEADLDTLIFLWQRKVAADRASPDQAAFTRQLLLSLGQGTPLPDGQMPISFRPTPYRVSVRDSFFYGRSALACLYLPALLGEPVCLETICPAYGSAIQLSVSQKGVTANDPPDCVLSVAVPGMTPGCAISGEDEPDGAAHQLTRFFSSAEAAALWLVAYPGVAILNINQAWRLVNVIYCEHSS